MKITTRLFGAYLKCPTKCWLRSQGEAGGSNAYADWVKTQNESYRGDGVKRLLDSVSADECVVAPPEPVNLKLAKWRLAVGLVAQASSPPISGSFSLPEQKPSWTPPRPAAETAAARSAADSCILESRFHAVERVPVKGRGKATQLIPIRFIFTNKLTQDDRRLLAFDAFVLSGALGRKVSHGRVIHGDDHIARKVKTSALSGDVRELTGKIAALLARQSPPDLILNRHCAECEFQARCRQKAMESDDLSLLAGMTEKERKRCHSKGIFTVTQLSYTFRPRRRPKRLRDKHEKYHHSLKALAVREKRIHILGSPELKIEGTPLYLDVEGLPERDFYYLIGVRIRNGDSVVQHSLWADTKEDEKRIWNEFLGILARVEKPVLMHYGRFESTFMRRLCQVYGGPPPDSPAAKSIESSANLLSVIFAQFYFPTHSNGLKDVARYLGFRWSDPLASGPRSIVVRHMWEQSRDPTAKTWLVRYNTEDCEALENVASALLRGCRLERQPGLDESNVSDVVNVESLRRQMPFSFGRKASVTPELEFLRKAAYWDYQRDRLYFRPLSQQRSKPRKVLAGCNATSMRINTIAVHNVSPECPTCHRIATRPKATRVRILYDLCFGQFSIKRWVVKHVYQTYYCWRCQLIFGLDERFRTNLKFGSKLLAYFVYQVIQLRIPQRVVTLSMNQLFGFNLRASTTGQFKSRAAEFYRETQQEILRKLTNGNLIHADETKANVKGRLAYVWVFTNHREVIYLYSDTREADMLHATLARFKGVLVSDFYAAYDSLDCPQQRCLTHLLRDLNDSVLDHPYDEELKELVQIFGSLVRPMVETVDRHGLKRHFLRKHRKFVDRFYRELGKASYQSEAALKCKERLEKNRNRLFTFLDYDGIPWNNNNAEHAIKAFAALRNVMDGTSTRFGG